MRFFVVGPLDETKELEPSAAACMRAGERAIVSRALRRAFASSATLAQFLEVVRAALLLRALARDAGGRTAWRAAEAGRILSGVKDAALAAAWAKNVAALDAAWRSCVERDIVATFAEKERSFQRTAEAWAAEVLDPAVAAAALRSRRA